MLSQFARLMPNQISLAQGGHFQVKGLAPQATLTL